MSLTLMSAVFALDPETITSTEAMVLLALADSANDEDGQTWLPIKRKAVIQPLRPDGSPKLDLVRKTKLGVRAIQFALRSLEAAGHLSRQEITGKGVIYTIHPGRAVAQGEAQAAGGESDSPRISCGVNLDTPRGESDSPKTKVTQTPLESAPASRPFLIGVEDLGGRTPGPDAGEEVRATVKVSPAFWEAWDAWVAMRAEKKKPVNAQAAEEAFRRLVRLARDGQNLVEVLDHATANYWTGLWPVKNGDDHERSDHRRQGSGPANPVVRAALAASGKGPFG